MTMTTPAAPPKFWSDVVPTNVIKLLRGPLLANVLLHYVFQPNYTRLLQSEFVQSYDLSRRMVFTLTTVILHACMYFGFNGMLMMWDKLGLFSSYQLPRTPGQLPSPALIRQTLTQALVSQFVTGPLGVYYAMYPIMTHYGMMSVCTSPPTDFWLTYRQFFVMNVVNITLFYWAHRLFHESAFLYRHIHKKHHQYSGSIGFAAEYAHPVEEILANMLPTIAGALFQGVNGPVWYVWLVWRLEQTYEVHGGFCFKDTWLDRIGLLHADETDFHDYHHTKNKGNYGNYLTAWDWLCGTSQPYLNDDDQKQK